MPSEAVSIDGYNLFRNDRNRHGGGVACFVRNEFPCTVLQQFDSPQLQTLWLLIRPPRMPRWLSHIAFGIVYNPTKSDGRAMTDHIVR